MRYKKLTLNETTPLRVLGYDSKFNETELSRTFNIQKIATTGKIIKESETSCYRILRDDKHKGFYTTRTHNIRVFENLVIIENNSSKYNTLEFLDSESAKFYYEALIKR